MPGLKPIKQLEGRYEKLLRQCWHVVSKCRFGNTKSVSMSNTKHKFIHSQKSPKMPKKHKNTQVLGPILDVSGLILDVFTAGNQVLELFRIPGFTKELYQPINDGRLSRFFQFLEVNC